MLKATISGLLMITLFFVTPAFAEGSRGQNMPNGWEGNNGVNRVVHSISGYISVKGACEMHFALPADATGIVTRASNPYNDKPSFYLGSAGRHVDGRLIEVDAGLQWDWDNSDSWEGWEAFIRNSAEPSGAPQYTNPRIHDPIDGWQPWRGESNHYSLDYSTTGGQLRLQISETYSGTSQDFYWIANAASSSPGTNENPTQWWPRTGDVVYSNTEAGTRNVKRVIAMTRATGAKSELDGSWIKARFSDGEADAILADGTTQRVSWTPSIVNQNQTGYDAPDNIPPIPFAPTACYDAIWNGHRTSFSRYIVDFPSLQVTSAIARTDTLASWNALNQDLISRYRAEDVHINLKSATRPVGLPLLIVP